MFRSSRHLPRPDPPPASTYVPSYSALCGLCIFAFSSLSSRLCSGGSSGPPFFPTLSASPLLFSLFGRKCAKLSPYFSYSSALSKTEHSYNSFIFKMLHHLSQGTGGAIPLSKTPPRRLPVSASNSLRMIFLACPCHLTLIESHSYKKQGEGVVLSPSQKRSRNIQLLPLWMRPFANAQ